MLEKTCKTCILTNLPSKVNTLGNSNAAALDIRSHGVGIQFAVAGKFVISDVSVTWMCSIQQDDDFPLSRAHRELIV